MSVQITTSKSINNVVKELERLVGQKQYWIHNRIGGEGWVVKIKKRDYVIEIDDPKLATFIKLKL